MEREQEIAKLVNVLRRTSRMALQSEWTGGAADTAAFCVEQYNRVLARLKEIDGSNVVIFEPLAEGSSLTVAAMACRQLAAFYEDEVPRQSWDRKWAKICLSLTPDLSKNFGRSRRVTSKTLANIYAKVSKNGHVNAKPKVKNRSHPSSENSR
jgi:hypothetical protein